LYSGGKVLLENIGETIDPVLEPLLARNTIKKGKYIRIGDKEIEYHPQFKYLLYILLSKLQAICYIPYCKSDANVSNHATVLSTTLF